MAAARGTESRGNRGSGDPDLGKRAAVPEATQLTCVCSCFQTLLPSGLRVLQPQDRASWSHNDACSSVNAALPRAGSPGESRTQTSFPILQVQLQAAPALPCRPTLSPDSRAGPHGRGCGLDAACSRLLTVSLCL